MKLAVMKNDPARREEGRLALAFLLQLADLNLPEVQGYFASFGFGELFHELRSQA